VNAPRTFYLTTPIYYVNARPHLGHAYTTIIADAMCRYRRLAGDRVWFLTGTDEHGDKIAQAAAKAGVSPQAYTDEISAAFRDAWKRLGIGNDDFIRTTEPRHQKVVQAILQTLYDAGEIYFGTYGGLYCFGCERFYTEKEAADGNCPQHQTALQFIEEENYFFKMSKYQDWLIAHIEARPDLIRPERYRNEVLGFLREPLQDLSISRPTTRLTWGIPLPFDDRFVTYVWFDALINYASALGGPGAPAYESFWPHVEHLIGKDILKPHGIYWPCMLKAAGMEVFRRLNVHGYWNLGGGKMSKSIGNVVEAFQLTDTYGHDAFRYFLMREMTFGLDANFSEEALVGRLNSDLANDLGNLVSRATTMIVNFAHGVVPPPADPGPEAAIVRETLEKARRDVDAAMAEFAFQRALVAIWEFIAIVNGYIDAVQPWALARDPARRARLDGALYTLAESLRCLAILLDAFLPGSAQKIRDVFGLGAQTHADLTWGGLAPGTKVAKPAPLFPRVEVRGGAAGEPSDQTRVQGLDVRGGAGSSSGAASASPLRGRREARPESVEPSDQKSVRILDGGPRAETAPATPAASENAEAPAAMARIPIDAFAKVELRVAQVLAAEAVPKSKKLLKLTADVGEGTPRTIVAGIAEHYAPGDLVGRKIVIVANLEPATLMGVESNGMLLAGSAEGALAILSPDRDLPPGARVN
jgi:methionyl-tRNA synthetase